MTVKYIFGDIHEKIKDLKDNTINLIYTSPPYGITKAKWDMPLKWDILFKEMWRVLKPNGIIVLHASMPFSYELLKYETPKYNYTWIKNFHTCPFLCKIQPLRKHEEVFVYYKKKGTYNPQMVGDDFHQKRNVVVGGQHNYYGKRKETKNIYTDEGGHNGRYPTTILEYPIRKDKTGITRTDEMMDYFIKTYSNENDTILDLTTHNEYLGNRVKLLNRNFIGIDIIPFNIKKIKKISIKQSKKK
jgi:site-specific DNA-methyltransferase (adenine-specific)